MDCIALRHTHTTSSGASLTCQLLNHARFPRGRAATLRAKPTRWAHRLKPPWQAIRDLAPKLLLARQGPHLETGLPWIASRRCIMFGKRWRLFRLLGIPISLDASWLIILALISWSLVNVFRAEIPGRPASEYWIMGVVTALAFFACIVLHELGHAVVARSGGMPIRGITLFLFGGVAELEGEPMSAGTEFRMAIAGPVVSAVLALLFWGLSRVGLAQAWAAQSVGVLRYLAWINATVLVFNLIPAFPLDGGRVLRSILWGASGNLRRATRWAAGIGQGFAWLLIAFGIIQFFADNFIGGIWLG